MRKALLGAAAVLASSGAFADELKALDAPELFAGASAPERFTTWTTIHKQAKEDAPPIGHVPGPGNGYYLVHRDGTETESVLRNAVELPGLRSTIKDVRLKVEPSRAPLQKAKYFSVGFTVTVPYHAEPVRFHQACRRQGNAFKCAHMLKLASGALTEPWTFRLKWLRKAQAFVFVDGIHDGGGRVRLVDIKIEGRRNRGSL